MKTPALSFFALALFVGFASAQFGRGGHADDGRVVFDNRSSSDVTLYRQKSTGKYQTGATLGPGEAFSVQATDGQVWTVGAPHWYRVVEAIKVGQGRGHGRGWGGNRVVVSDADLRSIGNQRLQIKLANGTGRRVSLWQQVGREEIDWARLERGRSQTYYAYQGQNWVVRDAATGEEIDRFSVGSRAGTINLGARRPSRGGHGGGGGWGRGHGHAEAATLVIKNRSSRSVAVLKRTALGSRTVGTIAPQRTGRIETEPGDVWRLEDVESLAVLETVTVPRGKSEITVDIAPRRPAPRPAHPPVDEVTLRFYNDTGDSIDIYRRQAGSWKHAKRINRGRFWDLDFEPGQQISIRDPQSGRVLEALRAPQGNRVIRVRGHGDHAHVDDISTEPEPGHDTGHAHDHRDTAEEAPIRDALRRIILGRE